MNDAAAAVIAVPGLRQAIRGALPDWRTAGPTLLYCLRTLAAIALALHVAFWLQLQSAASSAITVLIVANPVAGALISKSLWRLLGTLVGAVLAILLMAAFAQAPLLFFIAFSTCIGAACVVSTLLRYFKAYGAVLAGYTIIIVCLPAFDDPAIVVLSALSRVSAVSVGIVSAALVFRLTSLRTPSRLPEALIGLIRDAAASLASRLVRGCDLAPPRASADAAPDPDADRASLLNRAGGLQEIIEYAAADSYAVARQAGTLRQGAAGLIGVLAALHPLHPTLDARDPLAGPVRDAIDALRQVSPETQAAVLLRLGDMRDRLAERLRDLPAHADLAELAAIERVHDLLDRLHDAVRRLLEAPVRAPLFRLEHRPRTRLRPYLDWPAALRNGARGGIVTMLACLLWYVTQWPTGPTLLAYLVPAACLLSTNPSASRASIDFSIGTLLAIPASYVCETLMLPQISGFPLLVLALAICLLPGIWLQFHPRYGLRAFGYVVFFSAMIGIRNPARFDDVDLLNGWIAYLLGIASLIVVFRALLPADPVRDSNRLARNLSRATAALARRRSLPDASAWEYLQMQKLLRLIQRLQPLPPRGRRSVVDAALATIDLGRIILRLRALQPHIPLEAGSQEVLEAALRALRDLGRDPSQAAAEAETAARQLDVHAASLGQRRLAAMLREIATLTAAAAGFLRADFRVDDVR